MSEGETPPDQAPGAAHPRETHAVLGREREIATLCAAAFGPRAPHAWLFQGPEGVGKATLAYALARALLDTPAGAARADLAVEPEARAARLIAARSHPDLHVLTPAWDEKRKRFRQDVILEDVRRATAALQTTPVIAARRVLLIDAVDDLGRGCADALLKTLEEPPRAGVFIVVAHKPSGVPATLRSRCRRLTLRPLDEATTAQVIAAQTGLDARKAAALARAADGAPGRALRQSEAGDALRALERLMAAAGKGDEAGLLQAATALAQAADDRAKGPAAWRGIIAGLGAHMRRAVREAAENGHARLTSALPGVDLEDAYALQRASRRLGADVERLNLDRRGGVFELAGLVQDTLKTARE